MERKGRKSRELTARGSFFLHLAVGAVIGIGGVLPGVSGGVMAVSLGLYRPMIDAIAGFFKAPRKNFFFLLPIGLGAALGFFLGAVALAGLMRRWYDEVIWIFLGLVVGGVPGFVREANERGFKKRYLLATAAGAAVASLLLIFERDPSGAADVARLMAALTLPTPQAQAMISGAVVAVGTVIPGISTSFILMYLGWYRAMMDALANLDVTTVLFLALGAGGCFVLTVKAARWLFDRFHGYAYYAVLGFLIVSAALIVPELAPGVELLVSLVLAALAAVGAYLLSTVNM